MSSNCKKSSYNLFIVEDNNETLILYKKIFNYYGFNILNIANNGLEAIKKYNLLKIKPDVILMDYRMPLMNGIEASKKILQIDPDAKIIFISSDSRIKNSALAIGAKNFIEKPFKIDEVLHKISKVV